MKLLTLLASLILLSACGVLRPDKGDGAAAIPAAEGGGLGAVEGSPQNASDLGPGVVPH